MLGNRCEKRASRHPRSRGERAAFFEQIPTGAFQFRGVA
jgi:hypothetical protein